MGCGDRKKVAACWALQLALNFALNTAVPLPAVGREQGRALGLDKDVYSEDGKSQDFDANLKHNTKLHDTLLPEYRLRHQTGSALPSLSSPGTEGGDVLKPDQELDESVQEEISNIIVNQLALRLEHQEEQMTKAIKDETDLIAHDLATYNENIEKKFGDRWLDSPNFQSVKQSVVESCGRSTWEDTEAVTYIFDKKIKSDLMEMLTVLALIQSFGRCSQAAIQLALDVVTSVADKEGNKQAEWLEEEINEIDDPCHLSKECRESDIPVVRRILKHRRSLIALYDVAAGAIFAVLDNRSGLVNVLVKNLLSDFNMSSNVSEANHNKSTHNVDSYNTKVGNLGELPGRFRRDDCSDPRDDDLQFVLTKIPVVGSLYNVLSAASWEKRGCIEKAYERLLSGFVGILFDSVPAGSIGMMAAKSIGKSVSMAIIPAAFQRNANKEKKERKKGPIVCARFGC